MLFGGVVGKPSRGPPRKYLETGKPIANSGEPGYSSLATGTRYPGRLPSQVGHKDLFLFPPEAPVFAGGLRAGSWGLITPCLCLPPITRTYTGGGVPRTQRCRVFYNSRYRRRAALGRNDDGPSVADAAPGVSRCPNRSRLRLLSANIRGLHSNLAALQAALPAYDGVCLGETFL